MYKEKEFAHVDYCKFIENSWTFARLTIKEQLQLKDSIFWAWNQGLIKGTYRQRWETCQVIYNTFLTALDYEPTGWRERATA